MMRPVSVAVPPVKPGGLAFDSGTTTLSWNDNSIADTAYVVQKSTDAGVTWTDVETVTTDLTQPNTTGPMSVVDSTWASGTQYRIVAENTVGYGGAFPSTTASSRSAVLTT